MELEGLGGAWRGLEGTRVRHMLHQAAGKFVTTKYASSSQFILQYEPDFGVWEGDRCSDLTVLACVQS